MNQIIIELCAEDRARLDRLAEALERKACDKCVASALAALGKQPAAAQQAEAPTEAPKEAPGATEDQALPTTPAKEEKPAEATEPTEASPETTKPSEPEKTEAPTVTLDQIQQKVVQLAAGFGGAKKARVRAIINAYGAKVSDLKDQPDKWTEVWDKLTALENEG